MIISIRKRIIFLVGSIVLIASNVASAKSINDAVCLEKDSFYMVERKKLINYLLDKHGVEDQCIDINGDGTTTLAEKSSMLMGNIPANSCPDISIHYEHILSVKSNLEEIFNFKKDSVDLSMDNLFKPKDKNVTRGEIIDSFIDINKNEPEVFCYKGLPVKKDKEIFSNVYFRESLEEINNELKKAKGGKLFFEDDGEGNQNSTSVKFVLAGKINQEYFSDEKDEDENSISAFIPYVSMLRTYIKESDNEEKMFDRTIGVSHVNRRGFKSSNYDHKFQQGYSLTSEMYKESLVSDYAITYTPMVYGVLGDWLSGDIVNIQPVVSLKGIFGYVHDEGDASNLRDSEEFTRLGAKAGVTITGNHRGFENLQWDAYFTRLDVHNSTLDKAELWESSLVYSLDDNASVAVNYQDGHMGNNLEEVDKWDFSIAYKY